MTADGVHRRDRQAAEARFRSRDGGWGSGTDPDTSENIYAPGQNRNYGHYSNPEVDELFVAGPPRVRPAKRAAIYAQDPHAAWEDQPYTWLFYRNSFYGFNKKLRGYNFSPRGPFHYRPGFSSIYKSKPQRRRSIASEQSRRSP